MHRQIVDTTVKEMSL